MNGSHKIQPCDKQRILIADDDKGIRDMFELVLSCDLPECSIDMAANGREVIECFKAGRHGFVVLDIRMPLMDGEETYKEIKKICEADKMELPSFLFCTGFDAPHGIQNIVSGNPHHCVLLKPVEPDAIVEAIKTRLSR